MLHRPYYFSSDSVRLTLTNQDQSAAVEDVVKLLKKDSHVTNWNEFFQAMTALSTPPLKIDQENAVAIYHVRTNSVQDLIMAAGRSISGIRFKESDQLVRLIIVIGIPHALNQEYLRVLGSLARSLKEPALFQQLLTTESADEFIDILSQHHE